MAHRTVLYSQNNDVLAVELPNALADPSEWWSAAVDSASDSDDAATADELVRRPCTSNSPQSATSACAVRLSPTAANSSAGGRGGSGGATEFTTAPLRSILRKADSVDADLNSFNGARRQRRGASPNSPTMLGAPATVGNRTPDSLRAAAAAVSQGIAGLSLSDANDDVLQTGEKPVTPGLVVPLLQTEAGDPPEPSGDPLFTESAVKFVTEVATASSASVMSGAAHQQTEQPSLHVRFAASPDEGDARRDCYGKELTQLDITSHGLFQDNPVVARLWSSFVNALTGRVWLAFTLAVAIISGTQVIFAPRVAVFAPTIVASIHFLFIALTRIGCSRPNQGALEVVSTVFLVATVIFAQVAELNITHACWSVESDFEFAGGAPPTAASPAPNSADTPAAVKDELRCFRLDPATTAILVGVPFFSPARQLAAMLQLALCWLAMVVTTTVLRLDDADEPLSAQFRRSFFYTCTAFCSIGLVKVMDARKLKAFGSLLEIVRARGSLATTLRRVNCQLPLVAHEHVIHTVLQRGSPGFTVSSRVVKPASIAITMFLHTPSFEAALRSFIAAVPHPVDPGVAESLLSVAAVELASARVRQFCDAVTASDDMQLVWRASTRSTGSQLCIDLEVDSTRVSRALDIVLRNVQFLLGAWPKGAAESGGSAHSALLVRNPPISGTPRSQQPFGFPAAALSLTSETSAGNLSTIAVPSVPFVHGVLIHLGAGREAIAGKSRRLVTQMGVTAVQSEAIAAGLANDATPSSTNGICGPSAHPAALSNGCFQVTSAGNFFVTADVWTAVANGPRSSFSAALLHCTTPIDSVDVSELPISHPSSATRAPQASHPTPMATGTGGYRSQLSRPGSNAAVPPSPPRGATATATASLYLCSLFSAVVCSDDVDVVSSLADNAPDTPRGAASRRGRRRRVSMSDTGSVSRGTGGPGDSASQRAESPLLIATQHRIAPAKPNFSIAASIVQAVSRGGTDDATRRGDGVSASTNDLIISYLNHVTGSTVSREHRRFSPAGSHVDLGATMDDDEELRDTALNDGSRSPIVVVLSTGPSAAPPATAVLDGDEPLPLPQRPAERNSGAATDSLSRSNASVHDAYGTNDLGLPPMPPGATTTSATHVLKSLVVAGNVARLLISDRETGWLFTRFTSASLENSFASFRLQSTFPTHRLSVIVCLMTLAFNLFSSIFGFMVERRDHPVVAIAVLTLSLVLVIAQIVWMSRLGVMRPSITVALVVVPAACCCAALAGAGHVIAAAALSAMVTPTATSYPAWKHCCIHWFLFVAPIATVCWTVLPTDNQEAVGQRVAETVFLILLSLGVCAFAATCESVQRASYLNSIIVRALRDDIDEISRTRDALMSASLPVATVAMTIAKGHRALRATIAQRHWYPSSLVLALLTSPPCSTASSETLVASNVLQQLRALHRTHVILDGIAETFELEKVHWTGDIVLLIDCGKRVTGDSLISNAAAKRGVASCSETSTSEFGSRVRDMITIWTTACASLSLCRGPRGESPRAASVTTAPSQLHHGLPLSNASPPLPRGPSGSLPASQSASFEHHGTVGADHSSPSDAAPLPSGWELGSAGLGSSMASVSRRPQQGLRNLQQPLPVRWASALEVGVTEIHFNGVTKTTTAAGAAVNSAIRLLNAGTSSSTAFVERDLQLEVEALQRAWRTSRTSPGSLQSEGCCRRRHALVMPPSLASAGLDLPPPHLIETAPQTQGTYQALQAKVVPLDPSTVDVSLHRAFLRGVRDGHVDGAVPYAVLGGSVLAASMATSVRDRCSVPATVFHGGTAAVDLCDARTPPCDRRGSLPSTSLHLQSQATAFTDGNGPTAESSASSEAATGGGGSTVPIPSTLVLPGRPPMTLPSLSPHTSAQSTRRAELGASLEGLSTSGAAQNAILMDRSATVSPRSASPMTAPATLVPSAAPRRLSVLFVDDFDAESALML